MDSVRGHPQPALLPWLASDRHAATTDTRPGVIQCIVLIRGMNLALDNAPTFRVRRHRGHRPASAEDNPDGACANRALHKDTPLFILHTSGAHKLRVSRDAPASRFTSSTADPPCAVVLSAAPHGRKPSQMHRYVSSQLLAASPSPTPPRLLSLRSGFSTSASANADLCQPQRSLYSYSFGGRDRGTGADLGPAADCTFFWSRSEQNQRRPRPNRERWWWQRS